MNDELSNSKRSEPSRSGIATYLWAGALAAVVGFGAVYVIAGRYDNGAGKKTAAMSPAAQADSATRPGTPRGSLAGSPLKTAQMPQQRSEMKFMASKVNPLSSGKMATFVFKKSPVPLPEISFTDETGKPKTLKDWRGKVVLLNLWATWCAPCRREMPDLDRLQGELGSDKFEVVALSIDRKGIKASKRFLDQIKVKNLAAFNDATMRTTAKLKAIGMPTTLLIDAEGREIGRLVGPAEWHSDDAKRLIAAQL